MKMPSKCLPRVLRKSTRKREAEVVILRPGERIEPFDTCWGGGTKNAYWLVDLKTGKPTYPPVQTSHHGEPSPPIDVPAGSVCCVSGLFCGKSVQMKVYLHPDDCPTFLGIGVLEGAPVQAVTDYLIDINQDEDARRLADFANGRRFTPAGPQTVKCN